MAASDFSGALRSGAGILLAIQNRKWQQEDDARERAEELADREWLSQDWENKQRLAEKIKLEYARVSKPEMVDGKPMMVTRDGNGNVVKQEALDELADEALQQDRRARAAADFVNDPDRVAADYERKIAADRADREYKGALSMQARGSAGESSARAGLIRTQKEAMEKDMDRAAQGLPPIYSAMGKRGSGMSESDQFRMAGANNKEADELLLAAQQNEGNPAAAELAEAVTAANMIADPATRQSVLQKLRQQAIMDKLIFGQ